MKIYERLSSGMTPEFDELNIALVTQAFDELSIAFLQK